MTVLVEGLVVEYGDLRALDGVSFRVEAGEVFGLLGENGAGKSTTLRVLLGRLAPAAGRVAVADVDPQEDGVAARRVIGYVPERQALYGTLTPREHLRFAGRLRGLDEALLERRIERLLETFDLADRGDETLRSFSKGMRQKVQIALALLAAPPVLVLDEPLSGLDASTVLLVKELLRGLADRGTAVLYASHVLDVVERVCDRALILQRGRSAACGTIPELRARSRGTSLEQVFRSVASGRDPEAAARRLLEELDGGSSRPAVGP